MGFMKRSSLLLALVLVACGPNPALDPEPAQQPMPPPASTPSAPPTTPAATTDAGAKAEPSAEDKKKAEERAALEKDRLAMKEANEKEKARWTPEMKKEVGALLDKTYPTGKAAIEAAMKSSHRRPGR